MKFFTVYTNPNHPNNIKLVPNGFSWCVFILGAIGLLLQKSWIHGLIFLSFCLSLYFWVHPPLFIIALIHFLLACFAYHFQRKELTLSGWRLKTVVMGTNKQTAFLRLLDHCPELNKKICL